MATPVPSPDLVWSEELCATTQGDVTTSHQGLPNSFGYPLPSVQQAFEGNTEEPGTQQSVSGPRGGAGSGLRNHRDEQEAGMERRCQGSATLNLMAT